MTHDTLSPHLPTGAPDRDIDLADRLDGASLDRRTEQRGQPVAQGEVGCESLRHPGQRQKPVGHAATAATSGW